MNYFSKDFKKNSKLNFPFMFNENESEKEDNILNSIENCSLLEEKMNFCSSPLNRKKEKYNQFEDLLLSFKNSKNDIIDLSNRKNSLNRIDSLQDNIFADYVKKLKKEKNKEDKNEELIFQNTNNFIYKKNNELIQNIRSPEKKDFIEHSFLTQEPPSPIKIKKKRKKKKKIKKKKKKN